MRLALQDETFMYGPVKMVALGMFIHWGNKLCASPNAVGVGIPRGSDTSAWPCFWLGSVGVLCQALEACKHLVQTRAYTLDTSRHFESGTFLNRRHYCNV